MYKNKKNGFTLIEMLIVLFIITVLTLLFIPQISKRAENVSANGCDALEKVVEAQANAYYMEKSEWPTSLTILKDAGFINDEQMTCQDGSNVKFPGSPSNS